MSRGIILTFIAQFPYFKGFFANMLKISFVFQEISTFFVEQSNGGVPKKSCLPSTSVVCRWQNFLIGQSPPAQRVMS
jgi:hypothetical protein